MVGDELTVGVAGRGVEGGVAEDFGQPPFAHEDAPGGGFGQQDSDWHGLHDGLQPRLAGKARGIHRFAGGDVDDDAGKRSGLPSPS